MRKYLFNMFVLLVFLSIPTIYGNCEETRDAGNDVTVTYIGNAGFLINTGDKKILIDALFKGFPGGYTLPAHIREKLEQAQSPFDKVDLILATHAHDDHFSADMVGKHMKNNPQAIFVSTKQSVDQLNGFSDRSIVVKPTKGKPDKKDIQDFSIETFFLPHGPDSKTINIGFLVSVNGITFFQTGDVDFEQFTFDEFRSLQLPEKNIDFAFIQHYYLTGDPSARRFIAKGIASKYIIPIHYHYTTPAFDTDIIKQNYPYSIIFKEELQSWRLTGKKEAFPVLKGDYVGQPLPGDTAMVFAPGIISNDCTIEHGAPAFSPDGREVFWQSNFRQKGKETQIYGMTMKCIKGQWTAPEVCSYDSGQVFTPDGKRLYYSPFGKEDNNVHFVEKQGESWSQPEPLGLVDRFPKLKYTYMLSFTKKGTLYFLGHAEELNTRNNFGIYRSEFVNGAYGKPELLPPTINTGDGVLNWAPFIAPDESYLLFSSDRINSQQDLFICFRLPDGTWTEAHNMGPTVNTDKGERYPSISPDGKYLFFTRWVYRGNEDILWVSADIIKKLKKKMRITL